jgi:hypothetical protein
MSKNYLIGKGLDHIKLEVEDKLDHTVSPKELDMISDFLFKHSNNINL